MSDFLRSREDVLEEETDAELFSSTTDFLFSVHHRVHIDGYLAECQWHCMWAARWCHRLWNLAVATLLWSGNWSESDWCYFAFLFSRFVFVCSWKFDQILSQKSIIFCLIFRLFRKCNARQRKKALSSIYNKVAFTWNWLIFAMIAEARPEVRD